MTAKRTKRPQESTQPRIRVSGHPGEWNALAGLLRDVVANADQSTIPDMSHVPARQLAAYLATGELTEVWAGPWQWQGVIELLLRVCWGSVRSRLWEPTRDQRGLASRLGARIVVAVGQVCPDLYVEVGT